MVVLPVFFVATGIVSVSLVDYKKDKDKSTVSPNFVLFLSVARKVIFIVNSDFKESISSGSGGVPRVPCPPNPVQISHKKDGCQRWPHRFHVSWPPSPPPGHWIRC